MILKRAGLVCCALMAVASPGYEAAEQSPALQRFRQEIPVQTVSPDGAPAPSLLFTDSAGQVWSYATNWQVLRGTNWVVSKESSSAGKSNFVVPGANGKPSTVPLPPNNARQVLTAGDTTYVLGSTALYAVTDHGTRALPWPEDQKLTQLAVAADGVLHAASDSGLLQFRSGKWAKTAMTDSGGRDWGSGGVLGVAFGRGDALWIATRAGVGRRGTGGWKFYEGKDGVPWTDFTWVASGPADDAWFGTQLGVVYFDGAEWHYRQGKRWLLDDKVNQVAVDARGDAWLLTTAGVCGIRREQMTLEEKAAQFETEIETYIKRTPYGYVSEAALRKPGDRASADPQDSDNDGLWTAMYGAGECFAYAALQRREHLDRARQAFNALKFLQDVTPGSQPAPPQGFVARTIRPVDWPDPNEGRLEQDRQEQQRDRLWKVYEPRWPKSADGKWFWKSDTSSDELDGHYFFYPLYYEFCAGTEVEKERVRSVVRALTDHLVAHDLSLVDHDGKPTRWGIYGPKELNRNPDWWQERGLKSLSILSYLAVASFITGDVRYEAISRDLVERHGYAQNAMHPKVQHGPGSGNQSDDEMAFMCFYNLLRYSSNQSLKAQIRVSFYRYWLTEAPEMNPFFNFAYAAHCLDASGDTPWGAFPLAPSPHWLSDSLKTLRGFPLDRLNWAHQNHHRLDLAFLTGVQSGDVTSPDRSRSRGFRVNGKVLPVENRHFSHWNTDPWRLDYHGNADELAAGTVFLLPYYMGLYHGYIEKPLPASQSAEESQSSRAHE